MVTRLISGFLALMMLIGNTGITIQSHYCENRLKKLSLFAEPESCHAAETACHSQAAPQLKSCCAHKNKPVKPQPVKKDDCCNNQAQILHLDTDLTDAPSAQMPQPPADVFIQIPVAAVVQWPVLAGAGTLSFSFHPPPGGRRAVTLFANLRC